jgi:mono/diheme cytochrome c family protein
MAMRTITISAISLGVLAVALAASAPTGTATVHAQEQPRATAGTSAAGYYTEEQARRGAEVYGMVCAACHLANLRGDGMAPALIDEAFIGRWNGPVSELFLSIKDAMPADRPGTLSDLEYAAVIAYVLKMNRYPAGERELPAATRELKQISLARADVKR